MSSLADPSSPDSSPDSHDADPIAVVLAAGRGTRMKSELPKVLFPVLGRPMIHWVLDALTAAGFKKTVVVVGYRQELVREELADRAGVQFAVQSEQKGTGHAVQMCGEQLSQHDGPVLVVAGDSPLIQQDSLIELLAEFRKSKLACLLGTLEKEDPTGLGRIVRDSSGRFESIVEHADATEEQRTIREVNMSTYLFDCNSLLWALDNLTDDNAQGEYYVTDCPALLKSQGHSVGASAVLRDCESLSINTVDQLALVENKMREMGYPCQN